MAQAATIAQLANNAAVTSWGDTKGVDIAAPDKNGISHNVFTDLSVGSAGLVLNNSLTDAQSQILNMTIAANANLVAAGKTASLIVNEVTGTGATNLAGTTEVAGGKANLVFVNPNGITCDGCGFTNASRVTLAAANVRRNKTGAFDGFVSNGGSVSVKGAGVNALQADYFDIVASTANVTGNIQAKDLGIYTGNFAFNYAARNTSAAPANITAVTGTVLDASALGGMYADRVQIVARGSNVGINLVGAVETKTDNLAITSGGTLSLAKVTSAAALTVSATGNLTINDSIYGKTKVSLSAKDLLQKTGRIESGKRIEVKAAGAITLDGEGLFSGTDTNQKKGDSNLILTSKKQLRISDGKLQSPDVIDINAGAIFFQKEASIHSGKRTEITANSVGYSEIYGNIAAEEISISSDVSNDFHINGNFSSSDPKRSRLEGVGVIAGGNVFMYNTTLADAVHIQSGKSIDLGGKIDATRVIMLFAQSGDVDVDFNTVMTAKQIALASSNKVYVRSGAKLYATDKFAASANVGIENDGYIRGTNNITLRSKDEIMLGENSILLSDAKGRDVMIYFKTSKIRNWGIIASNYRFRIHTTAYDAGPFENLFATNLRNYGIIFHKSHDGGFQYWGSTQQNPYNLKLPDHIAKLLFNY